MCMYVIGTDWYWHGTTDPIILQLKFAPFMSACIDSSWILLEHLRAVKLWPICTCRACVGSTLSCVTQTLNSCVYINTFLEHKAIYGHVIPNCLRFVIYGSDQLFTSKACSVILCISSTVIQSLGTMLILLECKLKINFRVISW